MVPPVPGRKERRRGTAEGKRKRESLFLELEVDQDEAIYADIEEIDREMAFTPVEARLRRRATESTERSKFRVKKAEVWDEFIRENFDSFVLSSLDINHREIYLFCDENYVTREFRIKKGGRPQDKNFYEREMRLFHPSSHNVRPSFYIALSDRLVYQYILAKIDSKQKHSDWFLYPADFIKKRRIK